MDFLGKYKYCIIFNGFHLFSDSPRILNYPNSAVIVFKNTPKLRKMRKFQINEMN